MALRYLSLIAGFVLAVEPVVVSADTPPPFPEVKPKRIKAPAPGSRPRVDVQITAEEHARAPVGRSARPVEATETDEVQVAGVAPTPDRLGRYAWFWDKVSPSLEQSTPARLDDILRTLTSGGVDAPRMQALQDIARAQGRSILRSTIGTEVSPALVLAVIAVESAGKSDAVSRAGAQGLMQLMPDTAARFGVTDSLSPDENIAGGVKYLDWLMGEFGRDPVMVLAGYNAGEGAVRKHSGVPPYAETRDYVPKVLAAYQVARGLCATPPQLITDGCVFTALQ
ncbi:lytic transglycosylase domain-containing protein [Ruegeria marina]|uniref:Transglycosylase SLT domain-containing protein n=1 Tax=Ruegeria marina TaxID=639004 RepID=A0A1G6TNZ9_9RHOB|nr:lytic transglycosylase domain-containing protein [Ruegeria marina]SDD30828.1 Transglycosylase SLT domain-containing protein [Ruegeria marina]